MKLLALSLLFAASGLAQDTMICGSSGCKALEQQPPPQHILLPEKLPPGVLTIGPEAKVDVKIENLTVKEVADLENARKAFADAQAKLDSTDKAIRWAHGESHHDPGNAVLYCGSTSVELRGKFAIVTTEPCRVNRLVWP